MSMTDGKLEILIGKFLDGEISPGEQRVLDGELGRSDRARELLEELRNLRDCAREVICSDVLTSGADTGEVFEGVWQSAKRRSWRHIVRVGGRWRFAEGLAAGFLLGLVLHFVLVGAPTPEEKPTRRSVVAGHDAPQGPAEATNLQPTPPEDPWRVMRKVDWYSFTDETGSQWLIEGVREGVARPAAYHDDL